MNLFALIGSSVCALGACAGEPPDFPKLSPPRALTSGPHDHFLANYFAINAWSADLRHVAVLETDVNGRLATAGERVTLGLVDTWNANRLIPVTTTACWNFQEATMLHWLPNEPDAFVFNDLRDGKFVAVVMNCQRAWDKRYSPRRYGHLRQGAFHLPPSESKPAAILAFVRLLSHRGFGGIPRSLSVPLLGGNAAAAVRWSSNGSIEPPYRLALREHSAECSLGAGLVMVAPSVCRLRVRLPVG